MRKNKTPSVTLKRVISKLKSVPPTAIAMNKLSHVCGEKASSSILDILTSGVHLVCGDSQA